MAASTRKNKKPSPAPTAPARRTAKKRNSAGRDAERRDEAPRPRVSRIVEIRHMRGAVRVSLDLARHDFALAQVPSRRPSVAAREAELLNLPLKQALARLVDEFTHKYCVRLLAIEHGNVSRAARHAQYSLRGMRSMLERVGLLGPGR